MMTLNEMKLAVCEKLPDSLEFIREPAFQPAWKAISQDSYTVHIGWKKHHKLVHWPTEGLQVCWEAESLLSRFQKEKYGELLQEIANESVVGFVPDYLRNLRGLANIAHATYEQRLEALCRVWFPERWT